MKIIEHFEIPAENLVDFLREHRNDKLKLDYDFRTNIFKVSATGEYTQSEIHMLVLRTLINEDALLTTEEKLACEYAISCIKTLKDMGVIK